MAAIGGAGFGPRSLGGPTAENIPASRWVVVEIIAGLWEGIWGSLPIRAGDDGFVSGERCVLSCGL